MSDEDKLAADMFETPYMEQKRPPSPPPEPEQLTPRQSWEQSMEEELIPEVDEVDPHPVPPTKSAAPDLAAKPEQALVEQKEEVEKFERRGKGRSSMTFIDEEEFNADDMHFQIGGLFNLIVDEQRQRSMKRLIWYVLHLIVYCILCIWSLPDDWAMQQALLGHFASGFSESMFDSIRSPDEAWKWLENKVFPTLSAAQLDDPSSFFVAEYNRLLGPARFRQARVRKQFCWDGSSTFLFPLDADGLEGQLCWPEFSNPVQDVRLFKDRRWGMKSSETFSENLLPWSGDLEEGTHYGTKAQVLDIKLDCSATQNRTCEDLAFMRRNLWIDHATRALSIDMNFYNANVDLAAHLRFQLDFGASGAVYTTVELNSMRLRPYVLSRLHLYVRLASDLIFVLGVTIMLLGELISLTRQRLSYFQRGSNLLSFAHVSMYAMTAYLWVLFVFEDKSAFERQQSEFVDMGGLAARFGRFRCLASATVTLGFLQLLRFLKTDEFLSIFWTTLREAAMRIFWICVAFVCLAFGYALAGHIVFGTSMEAFHSFRSSCEALLEITLGSSTVFDEVQAGRAGASVVLFVFCWTFVVCLTLTNAIPAVLVSTYSSVTTRVSCLKSWRLQHFEVLDGWASKALRRGKKSESQLQLAEVIAADEHLRQAHDAVKQVTKRKLTARLVRRHLRSVLRDEGTEAAWKVTEEQIKSKGDLSHHQPALGLEELRKLCRGDEARTLEVAKKLADYLSCRRTADLTAGGGEIPGHFREALGLGEEPEAKFAAPVRVGLESVQDVREILAGLQKEVHQAEKDLQRCLGNSEAETKGSPGSASYP